MSNETTDKALIDKSESIKSSKIIYKTSKITFLFSFLAIVGVGFILYQGLFGRYNIQQQLLINKEYANKISSLSNANSKLQSQLANLKSNQQMLVDKVNNLNPNQTITIISQLNMLLTNANQSIIVYHDYASAIKLMNMAQKILSTTSEPLFNPLKESINNDMINLVTESDFGFTIVHTQIVAINDVIPKLTLKVTESNSTINSSNNEMVRNKSVWNVFITNIKEKLFGSELITRESNVPIKLSPANPELLQEKLLLCSMNLRQALLMSDSDAWNSNINTIERIVTDYYDYDFNAQKIVTISEQLKKVKIGDSIVNIDKSLDALSKLNLQYIR